MVGLPDLRDFAGEFGPLDIVAPKNGHRASHHRLSELGGLVYVFVMVDFLWLERFKK